MNKNRYKLVFSQLLNMLVPVSEVAVGGKTKSQRRARGSSWAVFGLLLGVSIVSTAWGDTTLPAGVSIRSIVGDSTRVIASDANKIHFEQLVPRAIVDFNQLNLARGQEFNVNMQANWSMLNRIHDINPSVLNGMVNAAGNLYFINSNGIIIGRDAQFNVGSLYAGTLNITNQLFQDGFVNEQTFTNPFSLVATIDLSAEARQKVENAEVLVESGAQINTTKNGKVMLFAPNVKVQENTIIQTPEGQTVLAAGKKVWLRGSADPAGFLVEVDGGGTATNLGKLIADRGNVSMMGLAVNQLGTVSASTSVRANGSIRLIAQDRANVVGVNVTGARDGLVNLGRGSVTEVRPEINDQEQTIVSQPFKTSEVLIEASMINIDGAISAKGGNVIARAEFNASSLLASRNESPINNGATRRIMLGENASIDVSGLHAIAPMSRNELEVQLFSDQLKDAPILRGGELFKSTVYVDARKGTSLFDIQPFLDLRPATLSERMTNAGNVSLSTSQELIMSPGSVVNVSGGSTTYTAGTIRESLLSFNGEAVPISKALPGVPYNAVVDSYSSIHPRWGSTADITIGGASSYVPTYFEGANAGSVNLSTPNELERTNVLLMSGQLIANTLVSPEQLLSEKTPLGGQLIASTRRLIIDNQATLLPSQFGFLDTLANASNFTSTINTDFLGNGFNRINFSKVDQITINQPLKLASHGSLLIGSPVGAVTRLNADIIAPNSDISIQSFTTEIGDNVTISSAGQFTNDRPGIKGRLAQEVARNGGNIDLGNTIFGQNVTLDASAGASVDSLGHFHQGAAGNISFNTYQALPTNLTLRSYGFDRGGELSIAFGDTAFKRDLFVASNLAQDANDISLAAKFFGQGGFAKYKLEAHNVSIGDNQAPDQTIYSSMQNWHMNSGFLNHSGQSMESVASPVTLPSYVRQASSFWFESPTIVDEEVLANLGSVTLASNTTLSTDAGGNVTMRAGKQVNVLGDINTPSGEIELSINDVSPLMADLPNQMVFIGEDANLNARGSTITLPDSLPKALNNKVLAAGSITINERLSSILKGAVVMKEGAMIDVSGVAIANDTRTRTGLIRETLFGDAGTINISGAGSMLLDGNFLAQSTGTGRDGSLNLLFNPKPFSLQQSFPNNSGQVFITQNKQLSASALNVGDALKNNALPATSESTANLKGQVSAEQIEQAGFANVSVKTYLDFASPASKLVFNDNVGLTLPGSLLIDSPITQVNNQSNVAITAGHITLRSPTQGINQGLLDNASSLQGNGRLSLGANQIYIDGVSSIAGVNQTNLNAQFDIHGQGARSDVQMQLDATEGGLLSNGQINITARQIYPESGSLLSLLALGSNSEINVGSSLHAASPILSAGGTLKIEANRIESYGVLSSPFGVIQLNADQIVLGANSVTSVSANNSIIPFGMTTTSGEVFNPSQGISRPLVDSKINLQANNIDLKPNAKLDLSASGDMFAFEWIPGLGGSADVLAQPNTYAVIPNSSHIYAPRDLTMTQSSAPVMLGKTVFLNGGGEFASGEYTLLPARYALVPGAFVVQLQPNASLLPGQTVPQADGSLLTTGYFADVSTRARDAQVSTFSIFSGSLFRPAAGEVLKAPSQYVLTSASTFFSDPAKTEDLDIFYTPKDVAKLGLQASQLTLEANVISNKPQGGRGLTVDISANSIRIVNNKDNTDTQSLQIKTAELNNLGAQSLLLGGDRSVNQDGKVEVNTQANSVSFENDAEQIIAIPELIATARERITVNDGAVINTGNVSNRDKDSSLLATGDGALLALSSNQNLSFTRQAATANAARGELLIGNNSRLLTANSAILDGTQRVRIDGSINVQAQGSVTLGANRILLGEAPSSMDGLKVGDDMIAAFGNLASLNLNSYSNLDTFGSVSLGAENLNLTINAAGIVGNAAVNGSSGSQVVITANQLTLKNTQTAILANAAGTASSLTLNANKLVLEGKANPALVAGRIANTDQFNIQGYNLVNLNADEMLTSLRGETAFDVTQVNMNVGRIGAQSGSIYSVRATGRLETAQVTPANSLANDVFAGRLTMQANDLVVGSRVESASGIITLLAENDLRLNSQAIVNVNAQSITFADVARAMPAGQVNLVSANGDISIDAGALVSANAQGDANAGRVNIEATEGALQLAGRLEGLVNGNGQGARLTVDVESLADINAVNSRAIGFNAARDYRVRQGDLTISGIGSQAISAEQISVTADNGQIIVSGELLTNSGSNGSIGLFAQNGLTLTQTASIDASSSDAGAEGGRIDLHTAAGMLNLQAGSTINLTGGDSARGGKLHLRAPRTGSGSGNGVGVSQLSTNIVGETQTVLEAFRVFDNVTSVVDGNGTGPALGFNTVMNDVTSFMTNRSSIETALGKAGDASFVLQAGTEIRNGGQIAVGTNAAPWNLFSTSNERTANDVGILSIRAGGDLQFDGSLSDGFTTASRNLISTATTGLLTDYTWSYRLVSGADLQSSHVLNTNLSPLVNGISTTGNLVLGGDQVIRTGTGFIDIATGGDLQLRNQNSVIYTAGRRAEAMPEFTMPSQNLQPLYLEDGGDINIRSQRNVVGAEANNGRQMVNQWLFRQGGGTGNRDTSWWVRPDQFRQGVATLGGGNISVFAGGDVLNFSASAPTTARFDNFASVNNPATGNSITTGGGDVKIQAAGNIVNGTFFVAQGQGELRAGAAIEPGLGGLGTVLALQDGRFNVIANDNIYISTTFNPTLVNQSSINASAFDLIGINSNFNTYSSSANVSISSVAGNVAYGNGADVIARNAGLYINPGLGLFFGNNPSKVSLTSFSGDISFGSASSLNSLVMLPASDGQLSLLASRNVTLGNIKMSDADVSKLPGINNPLNLFVVNAFNNLIDSHSLSLLHREDSTPALIIANQGNITSNNLVITIPKATQVIAGGDITNINFGFQNNRTSDVTLVKAGRDMNARNIIISGPGELLVQAGRNIDMVYPETTTINSTGNTGSRAPSVRNTFAAFANPALPTDGASITLQAGSDESVDVAGFINQYVLPTGTGPTTISNDPVRLAAYRLTMANALTAFMRQLTGNQSLDDAQALSLFAQQNIETQAIFANRHLSSELIASGRDFAKSGNHDRGVGAIEALFPEQAQGNILLFNSKVSTNSGGSVDLIAPGGYINVGVPGQGGDIGIITEKGGEIRAISDGDYQVNQSKTITQFGSDITVWSTSGTIDAGRGSKTATSIPERIVQTDSFGNTIIEVRGVAAGSGIRAQSYDPDGPNGPLQEPLKGNISLIAPVVDAGEAGIEAGDLLIVAPVVLNAANIQVQGIAAGVPMAAGSGVAGVSAGLSPDAVNSATQSVTKSLASSDNNSLKKPKLPSMISVDVIGMGDKDKEDKK